MDSTPILFQYLGIGLHSNFEENKLKYKHIFVEDGITYKHELDEMYDDFRIEFLKDKNEVDTFDLLNQITTIIDDLTVFHYEEIELYKPYITELPEFAEFERLEKKKYHDNQTHLLDPIVKYEIKIAKKVKQFIVKHRPLVTAHVTKQVLPLQERVIFEGEQSTLVTLFYALQLIKKLTFNKDNKYATDQLHLEDFLQKNFAYKKGMKYEDVKHAGKAISDIRHPFNDTGVDAKEKALLIIDACIKFLDEVKEEVRKVVVRHIHKPK